MVVCDSSGLVIGNIRSQDLLFLYLDIIAGITVPTNCIFQLNSSIRRSLFFVSNLVTFIFFSSYIYKVEDEDK